MTSEVHQWSEWFWSDSANTEELNFWQYPWFLPVRPNWRVSPVSVKLKVDLWFWMGSTCEKVSVHIEIVMIAHHVHVFWGTFVRCFWNGFLYISSCIHIFRCTYPWYLWRHVSSTVSLCYQLWMWLTVLTVFHVTESPWLLWLIWGWACNQDGPTTEDNIVELGNCNF